MTRVFTKKNLLMKNITQIILLNVQKMIYIDLKGGKYEQM